MTYFNQRHALVRTLWLICHLQILDLPLISKIQVETFNKKNKPKPTEREKTIKEYDSSLNTINNR